jgi:hypothetical protein
MCQGVQVAPDGDMVVSCDASNSRIIEILTNPSNLKEGLVARVVSSSADALKYDRGGRPYALTART